MKRALSVLLTVCLLLGAFSVAGLMAAAAADVEVAQVRITSDQAKLVGGEPTEFRESVAKHGTLEGTAYDVWGDSRGDAPLEKDHTMIENGQKNTYKIEVHKLTKSIKIDEMWCGRDIANFFEYQISTDGTTFAAFAAYGSNTKALGGGHINFSSMDTTYGRQEANEAALAAATVNTATDKKVIYIRLVAKWNDSTDGKLAFANFLVKSVLPADYAGTATTQAPPATTQAPAAQTTSGEALVHSTTTIEYRLDASPLAMDGDDPEHTDLMKANWKERLKDPTVVSDEKARLATAWARTIDPFNNGDVYMNVEFEGYVVYEFDLDDRTTSFVIQGWGSYKNMKMVASKDGKTWYTIADMTGKSMNLGSVDLPAAGVNIDQCQKNLEWVLTGNPQKKFLMALIYEGDDASILYANIILKATVNNGTDTSKDLPTSVPAGYKVPTAYVKPAHFDFSMNFDIGADKGNNTNNNNNTNTGVTTPVAIVVAALVSCAAALAVNGKRKKARE